MLGLFISLIGKFDLMASPRGFEPLASGLGILNSGSIALYAFIQSYTDFTFQLLTFLLTCFALLNLRVQLCEID